MLAHMLRLSAVALPLLVATANRPAEPDKTPFQVGEKFTYDAKINALKAGSATISIAGVASAS